MDPAHIQPSNTKLTQKITAKNVKNKIKTDNLDNIKLSIQVNEERILIGEVNSPNAANSKSNSA
jgi:hypothetical protein